MSESNLVALVSPAGYLSDKKTIEQAKALLESWGLSYYVGKHALSQHGHFAGTDKQRLSDMQTALDNPEVAIIWALRGGYGAIRIAEQLDFTIFNKHPKLLVGFSDITIFHALWHNLGYKSLHALMPVQLKQNIKQDVLLQTHKAMTNQGFEYAFPYSKYNQNLSDFSGIVVGGNLANLYSLLGTDLDIDTAGKILFIEDVGEQLYNIDRMMIAMKKAGKLKDLKALLVGQFTDIPDNEPSFGYTYQEIIKEHTADYDFPVIFDVPIGHVADNYPLMFGAKLQVKIEKNQIIFQQ